MAWRRRVLLGSAVVLVTAGCGSDSSAVCTSNGVGEVCAESSDGQVDFTGRGLEPGSEVEIEGPDDAAFVLAVGPDGSLTPVPGATGFLYAFADADLVVIVSAVDSAGTPFDGEIVVST